MNMSRLHGNNPTNVIFKGGERRWYGHGRHARRDELPRLMTIKEVSEALRMSKSSIYRLIDAGRLRCARPGPRKTLVYWEDVQALIVPLEL